MNFIHAPKRSVKQQKVAVDGGCDEHHVEVQLHSTDRERGGKISAFAAEKIEEIQQNRDDAMKGNSPKKEKHLFMDKLHDGLYELGGRERTARRKAKDDAHTYNKLVNKQICQSCNEAQKKLDMNQSHECRTCVKEI